MTTKTVRFSDLTGNMIEDKDLAQIRVSIAGRDKILLVDADRNDGLVKKLISVGTEKPRRGRPIDGNSSDGRKRKTTAKK